MDFVTEFVVWLLVFFIFILIMAYFITNIYVPFKREHDYIKYEIERSDEDELEYWKHKLKTHYLRYIPVVKHFFINRK